MYLNPYTHRIEIVRGTSVLMKRELFNLPSYLGIYIYYLIASKPVNSFNPNWTNNLMDPYSCIHTYKHVHTERVGWAARESDRCAGREESGQQHDCTAENRVRRKVSIHTFELSIHIFICIHIYIHTETTMDTSNSASIHLFIHTYILDIRT